MRYLNLLLIGALLIGAFPCNADSHESAELAAVREKMKNRTRRLIYNNDGCDVFLNASTPEGFLSNRMTSVPGTQVDSVFYCTGATVMFSHDTKTGETYGKWEDTGNWGTNVGENCAALIASGKDTLALVVEYCKQHDLEVFFTHRINDIHDSVPSGNLELSTWKRDNPQYMLGKQADQGKYDDNDPRYWWSSLDFEHPQVREYLLACVQDVCSRYDIDGYDIDYFRSPMFFKPNLDRKPVTAKQIAILTDFQRKVREIAYREGNKRGRPILVSVRVPMTVKKCRHVGIDIKKWLKDDLFDVLTTGGGYVPLSMPTRDMVELGHQYDKPVYPTISRSGMQRRFIGIKAWKGAAASIWANGADGIVLFNTFPGTPDHPHFTMLGDPDQLRYEGKIFGIDDVKVTEADLQQGIEQDQALPIQLKRSAKAVLPIGDDLAAAAKAGKIDEVTLLVRYKGLAEGEKVNVRVNGRAAKLIDTAAIPLTVPGRIGHAMKFNGLRVLTAGNPGSLQITTGDFSFSMWVKTRQKESWAGFLRFYEKPGYVPAVKLYFNAGINTISMRTIDKTGDWTTGGGDTLLDGQWHHYAATFDRDGDAVVYIDGAAVGTQAIGNRSASLGTNKFLEIGRCDRPYEGLMDDLRMYNRALSANDVRQIATGKSGDPAGSELLGWWKFDEKDGQSFADSSGKNHTATLLDEDTDGTWLTYIPDPATLKQGANKLNFLFGGREEVSITNVELHVSYKEGSR
jgi:hypothetical protein